MARLSVNRETKRKLLLRLQRNAELTGFFINGKVQQVLSKGQPVRKVGDRLVGTQPSKPGQPPRTLSGRLRQSVFHRVRTGRQFIKLRIGTAVGYGQHLEPPAALNRPFLRSTIIKNRRKIVKRLGKK